MAAPRRMCILHNSPGRPRHSENLCHISNFDRRETSPKTVGHLRDCSILHSYQYLSNNDLDRVSSRNTHPSIRIFALFLRDYAVNPRNRCHHRVVHGAGQLPYSTSSTISAFSKSSRSPGGALAPDRFSLDLLLQSQETRHPVVQLASSRPGSSAVPPYRGPPPTQSSSHGSRQSLGDTTLV